MQNAAPMRLQEYRDFGQIISATFRFLRENWRPLLRSLAVVCVPLALISGFFMGKSMGDFMILGASAGNLGDNEDAVMNSVLLSMLPMIFGYLLMAITMLLVMIAVNEYLAAYHDNQHQGMSTGDLWKRVAGNIGSYIGIGILSLALIMVGMVLCYLPGIYVAVVLSLSFIAFAVERRGAIDSMKRSNALVKDHWWETFGLVLVMSMIQTTIIYALMMPFFLIFNFADLNTWVNLEEEAQTGSGMMPVLFAIGAAGYTLLAILTYPMLSVAVGLKYFSLKEEKEGVGIRNRIQGFEQA